MDIGSLVASIGADISDLKKAVNQANKELEGYQKKTESELSKADSSWKKSSSFILKTVGVLGAGFAALKLKSFIQETAMAGARYETLGVILHQVGKNAGYTALEMDKYANGVKEAGIQMDTARQVTVRMSQAQIDLSKAQQLARIAQDAAVIGNMNSSQALERMIHGIQTAQTDVLRYIGINVSFEESYKRLATQLGTTSNRLNEQQKMQARTNAVMEEGTKIAGTYEAAMETAGKQITSLPRYINDFKIKMGEAFNPATAEAVKSITNFMKVLNEEIVKPEAQQALQEISLAFAGWVTTNSELIQQNLPEIINDISIALELMANMAKGAGKAANLVVEELKNVAIQSRAFGLASGGYITWGQAIFGTFEELEVIIKHFDLSMNGVTQTINKQTEGWEEYSKHVAVLKLRITQLDLPLLNAVSNWKKQHTAIKNSVVITKEYEAVLKEVNDVLQRLKINTGGYVDVEKQLKYLEADNWRATKIKQLGETNEKIEEATQLMKKLADQEEGFKNRYSNIGLTWDDSYLTDEAQLAYQAEQALKRVEDRKKAGEDLARAREEWAERQKEADEKAADAFKDFSETVQDYTADIISDWDNMGDTLVKIMKRTVAEMVAALVSQQFIVPITMQIGSALGLSWNGTSFGSMLSSLAGGGGISAVGGTSPLSILSAGRSAYNTFSGGGIGSALTQGPLANLGSSVFGNAAWYGTGASTSATGAAYYGGSAYMVPAEAGASGSMGISGALGNAATGLGSAVAGFMIGKMISGGYSALGESSSIAVGAGTAIGTLLGGPIGSIIGGALGGLVNAAFGHKAPEVTGSGLAGTFSTDNADIRNYQTWKAEGGWFSSSKHGVNYSAISSELDDFLDSSLSSLTNSTKSYANVLGLSADRINGITQSVSISMAGLNDEQKEKALADAFADFGDLLAKQYTEIAKYVRAGESYSETLGRLGSSLLTVNSAFEMLDVKLFKVKVSSGNTASKLVDLFGGIDAFNQSISSYYDKFYSTTEKSAYSVETMEKAFLAMNMSIPPSLEQYRKLVESQNLLTQSGRETYAALIAMAPAFAQITGGLLEPFMEVTSVFDDFAERFKNWITYLKESGYTLQEVAEAERQRNLALGLQFTGLNVNSVGQSLLSSITGGTGTQGFEAQLTSIIGNTIASAFTGSITNKVMGTLVKGFEEEIGAEFGRLGYNVGSLFERLPEMLAAFKEKVGPTSQALEDFSVKWQEMFGEQIDTNAELIASEEALQKAREQAQESIQKLIDNLMGGDLAPVQSMEFFTRRYAQLMEEAMSSVGTEEYGNKVSNLTSFIPDMLDFAMAYGGNYKDLFNSIMADLGSFPGIVPQFASGGYHDGGLALVHGQELISSGPATISNKNETLKMISEAVRDAVGGESKNINLTVNLKVGTHEFRSIVMESIKVDPETQRQIRRVANG